MEFGGWHHSAPELYYYISLQSMTDDLVSWLSNHQLPCIYKQVFGVSCPMCGCQRGLLLMMQGDLWGALRQFPPLAAWAATAVTLMVFVCMRKPLTYRWQLLLYANLAVLFANAVYQNLLF